MPRVTTKPQLKTLVDIPSPKTAVERGLRAVTRGTRVAETLKADVV